LPFVAAVEKVLAAIRELAATAEAVEDGRSFVTLKPRKEKRS
jgi:hypothetical protein